MNSEKNVLTKNSKQNEEEDRSANDAAVLTRENQQRARQAFSTAGFACFAILALGYAVNFALKRLFPGLKSNEWGKWFLSFAPLYLVGLPVSILIFQRIPAHKDVDRRGGTDSLKPGQIVRAAFIAIFLVRVGSFIGDEVTQVFTSLTGASAESGLAALSASNLLAVKFLVMAIIGPLIEELVFRKLLIDRIGCYGGKLAVITSGLMFGLFHGNFSQFFYAAAVGLVFAYIYLKTGKYRYSAGLHILVNSIAVLESTFLLSAPEILTDIESASGEQLILLVIWGLLEVAAVIIGLIFFCRTYRKVTYERTMLELPKGSKFRTAYLNFGMLLFVVFCAALFVKALLP